MKELDLALIKCIEALRYCYFMLPQEQQESLTIVDATIVESIEVLEDNGWHINEEGDFKKA